MVDMCMPIFVIVEGGLGNQLFQAAFGEFLGRHFNSKVFYLSITKSAKTPRSCALADLGFRVIHLSRLLGWMLKYGVNVVGKLGGIGFPVDGIVVKDEGLNFDVNTLTRRPLLVFGYWQYAEIALSSVGELAARINEYAKDRGLVCGEVSFKTGILHVRCGDYISDPEVAAKHHVCTPGYYEAAWHILQHKGAEELVVFTDDPMWVKGNLNILTSFAICGDRGVPPLEEMWRMSHARYFAISNSTFGWWAAALANKPGVKVIAPKHWFVGVPSRSIGILPDFWEEVKE